mmetsp:Transcript_65635/g.182592  ORF Transcript_65635/g.182592 Transcript_65635/m.182592 type:complete len:374 (+) Transcript_65635:709-1830(+)|eukprot:CAMPEP_0117464866 /NCGR_PEP_ID=MMETSP0784-20121206/4327_1 /TAXON_ID=39447 /ORGANISM="" /LENGTH=373 /DNA_ID=CAMNT_0005258749 /DNA_START=650 /DNA_END=1771 /DNA_ORIENTATION=-
MERLLDDVLSQNRADHRIKLLEADFHVTVTIPFSDRQVDDLAVARYALARLGDPMLVAATKTAGVLHTEVRQLVFQHARVPHVTLENPSTYEALHEVGGVVTANPQIQSDPHVAKDKLKESSDDVDGKARSHKEHDVTAQQHREQHDLGIRIRFLKGSELECTPESFEVRAVPCHENRLGVCHDGPDRFYALLFDDRVGLVYANLVQENGLRESHHSVKLIPSEEGHSEHACAYRQADEPVGFKVEFFHFLDMQSCDVAHRAGNGSHHHGWTRVEIKQQEKVLQPPDCVPAVGKKDVDRPDLKALVVIVVSRGGATNASTGVPEALAECMEKHRWRRRSEQRAVADMKRQWRADPIVLVTVVVADPVGMLRRI